MKYLLLIVYFILLNLSCTQAFSQKILTLNKPGYPNRIRYYENQEISFKLKGEKVVHTGLITQLNDTMFLLNTIFPVKISDITMVVDYKKGAGARFFSKVTLAAGLLYLGLGAANSLIFGSPPGAEGRFLVVSGALIGTSFLLKPFCVRKYRINKNRYLKVIDVTI